MPDLRTQLRDYFEEIAPPVSSDEAREPSDVIIPAAPATVSRPRRLLPVVVGFVVVVLALLAAGLLDPQAPEEPVIGPTPTTVPAPEPTTTVVGARVDQAALARARWVTHGPDGLRTDDGTLLWETEVSLGATFVARDGEGGLAYMDAQGLWWIAPGAETPQLVAGEEVLLPDPTLVEVIPTSSGPVARIGFSRLPLYVDLPTGELLAEGPPGRVQEDGSWVTANGLGVRIVGPEVTWEAEGGVEEVLEPAHLIVEWGDEVLAEVVVGTDREPFGMVYDFDGRTVIVSRYPHEPALPAVDFFVIDLGCADCQVTFRAGATWVALVGADTEWSGPVEAPDWITRPLGEALQCEPAPFRVTILPWLESGELLPEPEVDLNVEGEGKSILTWKGPPGTRHEGGRGHVSIVRYPTPSPLGGPGHPVDIPVRDTLGEIQWVGDPGVGEVRLAWLEADGNCGFYALYLWDITLTEEESEQYLREAVASLTEP